MRATFARRSGRALAPAAGAAGRAARLADESFGDDPGLAATVAFVALGAFVAFGALVGFGLATFDAGEEVGAPRAVRPLADLVAALLAIAGVEDRFVVLVARVGVLLLVFVSGDGVRDAAAGPVAGDVFFAAAFDDFDAFDDFADFVDFDEFDLGGRPDLLEVLDELFFLVTGAGDVLVARRDAVFFGVLAVVRALVSVAFRLLPDLVFKKTS